MTFADFYNLRMSTSMTPDDQVLANLNIKPEVKDFLSWDFLPYLDFPENVWEVRGGPLLELISVHVRPNIAPHDNPMGNWRITATISTTPPIGTFPVLSLPPQSPAVISDSDFDTNGFAPLTGLVSGPIVTFFPSFHAHVNAKDMERDCVLVDTSFEFSYKDFKEFDQVQYTNIQGALATLRVKHITYRAALVATVSVKIIRSVVHGTTDGQVEVSGSVIGSCHYEMSHISVNPPFDEPNSPCITLFDSEHPVPVSLGHHMTLSMPVMAVPSYSYLALHISLHVAGFGSIKKISIFKGIHSFSRFDTIEGPEGLVLKVTVDMGHECEAILPLEAYLTDDEEVLASTAISPAQPIEVEVTIDEEAQPSSFFLYKYWQVPQFEGDTLMEVFTIFIALRNNEPCKIHGRVEVFDALRKDCCIYDHDDSNAEEISENNRTISLHGPHDNCFAFEWNELGMKINLKDGNRQFCKGVVCWSHIGVRDPWLDNHMCSVIKGDIGYAAVYYGIFKKAVQAKVRVFLTCNADTYVSGSIFGEHDNFDYSTHFERECYRSVIFSRDEGKAQALSMVDETAMPLSPYCFRSERSKLLRVTGIEMSLLKSAVVVPEDTSLVLELDLLAKTSIDGANVEVCFKNRVEFKVDHQTCWVRLNNNCQICVFVDWDTVLKDPRIRKQ